jgi:hypothetical protein
MTETGRKVALGMIGGCLITMGLGWIAFFLWFLVWSHHMFIVGFSFPRSLLAIAIPSVLMTAGVMVARRAFRRP